MNILIVFIFLHVVYCKIVYYDDNEIQYFGRWQKTTQDIQSISSGAYLKTRTNSEILTLRLSQPASIIIQLNNNVLFKKEAIFQGVFPIELQVDISSYTQHSQNHTLTFVSDIQSSIHLQSIEMVDQYNHYTVPPSQHLIEFVGHDLTLGLGTSQSIMTSFPWIISNLLGTERSQIAYQSAWLMNHSESLGMESLYFQGESFYSPRIVTILLGEYDQYPNNYTYHLFRFLSHIRHQFPTAILFVLSEPLGVLFHESQEAVYLMDDPQHVYFIDTTSWIRFGKTYYLDALHLNDQGQALFAKKLAPYLNSKLIDEPFPPPPPNPNLPYQWQTMDIGTQDDIGLTGSVSFDSSHVFTLWGSGHGLEFGNDSFRYVYQPLSGMGVMTVTLVSHTSFDACAKAGILLRDHLAPHAPHVMLGYSPELGLFASDTHALLKTQRTPFHPIQLRIEKNVHQVRLYVNQVLWHTHPISLARDVYLGLAVTSCNRNVVSVAKFADVRLEQTNYGLMVQ